MSYEEIHLHLHLSQKRHHFVKIEVAVAVVSQNNKHIKNTLTYRTLREDL